MFVKYKINSNIWISFQSPDKNVSPNDVNIAQIIVHPDYRPPKKYYDIALMKLEKEVGFTQLLQPACLWPKDDLSELGSTATLTGWGVLQPGTKQTRMHWINLAHS